MPPFHSRSTGAVRMADSSSFGVMVASVDAEHAPHLVRLSTMALAVRGHTPPPAESGRRS